MAVALSLLIVLPGLAQVSGDRTDGRLSVGNFLDIRVADNLDDLDNSPGQDTPAPSEIAATGQGAFAVGTNAFQARDTYFDGDLYVSNDEDAFNTVLITARVEGTTGSVDARNGNLASELSGPDRKFVDHDSSTTVGDDADNITCLGTNGVAVATVRNERSGARVTAYLLPTTDNDGAATPVTIYQGIAAVWDQEDSIEAHHGPCDVAHVDPAKFVEQDDPPDASNDPVDGWMPNSAAVIPARDGDTITISVKGVSGSISLIVDGDAPEIDELSPGNGETTNKTTVSLGFRVRDTGAGVRYDGESGVSQDQDPEPHNGDGDQVYYEPITAMAAGPDGTLGTADDVDGDGGTLDIEVYYAEDDEGSTLPYLDASDQPTADPDDGADPPVAHRANPDYAGVALYFDPTDEKSEYGTNGWTQNAKGASYTLAVDLVENKGDLKTFYWQVEAVDRVGNKVITDGDDTEKGDQPFSFKIDDKDPLIESARTGIGYKAGKGEFKDRSWIALNFINEGTGDGEPGSGDADRLNAGTVDPGDFTVEGHTVIDAFAPAEKAICNGDIITLDDDDAGIPDGTKEDESAGNITAFDAGSKPAVPGVPAGEDVVDEDENETIAGAAGKAAVGPASRCVFEPRARVYLQLGDELESDETPDIQVLGGVLYDVAGNPNAVQQFTDTVDKIAPGISIAITATGETTNRTATDDEGSFTVRVSSDEDLVRFPRLYFATIKGEESDDGAEDLLAKEVSSVTDGISFSESETNVWQTKVNADDDNKLPGNNDRILAVLVTAEDEAGNSGNSPGWKDAQDSGSVGHGVPSADDELDFEKLAGGGFLVEIDSTAHEATIEVLPSSGANATESRNPYIRITFAGEATEYGIEVPDGTGTKMVYKADIGDGDTLKTDSHTDVTFTKFELNGDDRKESLVRVKAGEYVLAVTGLDLGEYTISYVVEDDIGNEYDSAEKDTDVVFEVEERSPYEVRLDPGWNLISFPGDPFNPGVGDVIGDLKADSVLSFQQGEWVTAVRDEEGSWRGTLTDLVGGYGYWVRTTVVETIETVIPPILPTANLPTAPIVSGWNLIGVVDAEQRDVGTAQNADNYLISLPGWRVAYGYETRLNSWQKLLPKTTPTPATVENGKGYWVWSTSPGTLVP